MEKFRDQCDHTFESRILREKKSDHWSCGLMDLFYSFSRTKESLVGIVNMEHQLIVSFSSRVIDLASRLFSSNFIVCRFLLLIDGIPSTNFTMPGEPNQQKRKSEMILNWVDFHVLRETQGNRFRHFNTLSVNIVDAIMLNKHF